MEKFVSIPAIESSLHIFGGHIRTVPGGWSFFEQKHQAFELMCIIEGHQTTVIGDHQLTYGPGDALFISPGTLHNNYNSSKSEKMTYICFHFNIESLQLKSEIISYIANDVIHATNQIAQIAIKTAKEMIVLSDANDVSLVEKKLKIQIEFLQFIGSLLSLLPEYKNQQRSKYSEREAQVARSIAMSIETAVENANTDGLNFGEICKTHNISSGYGHRVFKKVYGITPLHLIEEQKYRKAKLLLGTPEYSIEQISYMIGAPDQSSFSKQFKKWSGLTPSKYQQQINHKRKVSSLKESGYFE